MNAPCRDCPERCIGCRRSCRRWKAYQLALKIIKERAKKHRYLDLHGVFLNLDEFAERHTVIYDGETYEDIPVVITGLHERDRRQLQSDHAQGLYLVSRVMHCALDDLGGNQPEKGCRIRINEREGGSFFHDYYVASSICEMGMLRVELEDVDE